METEGAGAGVALMPRGATGAANGGVGGPCRLKGPQSERNVGVECPVWMIEITSDGGT